MLSALTASVAQLREPVHRGVLLRALGCTLLLFIGLWWACERLLAGLDTSGWPNWLSGAWANGGPLLASLLVLPLFIPLFAAVSTGVAELWLDQIVGAVEAKHYPRQNARPVGWAASARLGLAATARLILFNLIALPFYLLLLVTGVGPLALFIVVNGWLLGRAYLEMVAARHMPIRDVASWIKAHGGARWQVGLVTAALFAVPVINLAAPLIGAGMATHLFHRTRKSG